MALTRKSFLQIASRAAAGSIVASAVASTGESEAARPLQTGGGAAQAAAPRRAAAKGVTAAVVKFVTTARYQDFPRRSAA